MDEMTSSAGSSIIAAHLKLCAGSEKLLAAMNINMTCGTRLHNTSGPRIIKAQHSTELSQSTDRQSCLATAIATMPG